VPVMATMVMGVGGVAAAARARRAGGAFDRLVLGHVGCLDAFRGWWRLSCTFPCW
jgi:hypothetical protein